MDRLLSLLEQNARLTNKQLAVMLETTEAQVAAKIEQYEEEGIIRGYTTVLDREKFDKDYVLAIIELKVTPKPDYGFEEIARRIAEYTEVESVYLMSGGFDLAVFVNGRTFKDIALFVSKRLAVLDSVVSTATHFLLSRYKDKGFMIADDEIDERSV
ncbi:MAG: Lrp/AsnC family transcriptional regulator [Massiliimalia sp.]|jgi:DNA-binding Lrp family transcriptional regulator